MTRIADLGEDAKKLADVLAEYEAGLEGIEEIIKIEGKNLEHANRENPAWQLYYDQRRVELVTIVKYLEARVNAARGKLWKQYTESFSRDLSDRAKDKYIDNEPLFLTWNELYLEAKELYDKYQGVVDTLQARAYSLNNITKLRVASLENIIV